MKEYCVDLDIAMELKINEFPQESNFYWYKRLPEKNSWKFIGSKGLQYKNKSFCFTPDGNDILYSAPTAEELIKELPREIKDLNFEYFYHLKIEQSPIHDERFLVSYGITNQDRAWMEQHHTEDKKLSNALALMWKLLKKEGYIHEVQRQ